VTGLQEIDKARAAGFSDIEIQDGIQAERQKALNAGFSEAEFNAYYGQKEPNLQPVKDMVSNNLGTLQKDGAKPVTGFLDVLDAGLQISVSGLLARGEAPTKVISEEAPWLTRQAGSFTTVVGDIPFMVSGALIGGASGGGIFSAATATAGAFALPAGLRATLMDSYENGEFRNFGDFWDRASGIILDTVKGYVTGAATGSAGFLTKAALPAATTPIVKSVAPTASEIVTMTTVGAALEGEVPTAQDFIDTAIVIGGLKASVGIARKLRNIYTKTGIKPSYILEDVRRDATIKQDLLSDNIEIPKKYTEAYHGTPHDIAISEGFKLEKVGAGEGAQAFGHGIYFAQKVDTAGFYAEKLGVVPDGLAAQKIAQLILERAKQNNQDVGNLTLDKVTAAVEEMSVLGGTKLIPDNIAKLATNKEISSIPVSKGNLYKVEIPEESVNKMLDWDLPLSQQPVFVQKALKPVIDSIGDAPSMMGDPAGSLIYRLLSTTKTGYSTASEAAASFELNKLGIPGIKYLDQGSRARDADIQTYNYVLFDPSLAKIIEKNGQPVGPPSKPPPRPPGSPEPSDPQKEILSKIRHIEPDSRWTTLHEFYTQVWDQKHPLKVAETLVKKSGVKYEEDVGPYIMERLNAGIFGKADHFLKKGTFDSTFLKKTGPSYQEILKPVQNDLDGFRAYMTARRAIEYDERGFDSGFNIEAAKKVVKEGKSKYEKVFQDRLAYRDSLVNYLIENGILNKETAAKMRNLNKAYVHFYRMFEEEGTTGVGTKTVRNPIKRVVGGKSDIMDPILADVQDTFLFITLAERNASRQELVKTPGLAEKVKTPIRPIELLDSETKKILLENGIKEKDTEPFTIFRALTKLPERDEIVVFEDGKRLVYRVDPAVAEVFNGMDSKSASMLAKLMFTPASLLRAGTVLSPDFLPRNLMRDALSSVIYAGSHPIKTIKGGISYVKEDEAYQRWLRGGGANATMVSMDKNYLHEHIFDLNQKTGFMNSVWNRLSTPVQLLRVTGELFENATRLGAIKDDILQAKTRAKIQALAYISREATVDFSRRGSDPFLKNWSYASAFMNPGLQGIDRMFRAFKDYPVETSAKAFAYITIPSILLWYANHDDDWVDPETGLHVNRWDQIPDWQKDLFWVVMTDDHVYLWPKPFELGVVFGSLPERLLEKFFKDNPDQLEKFSRSFIQAFIPNLLPTVVSPIIEQQAEYSYFLDRPLVPYSLQHLLPAYQYTDYTSEATKALGRIIGDLPGARFASISSPIIIDNYIRQWSGGLGNYAVRIADAALRKTGVLPDPVKPAGTLSDIPFVRAFVLRFPSASAQSIQDFYDNYNKSQKVIETVKVMAARGDIVSVEKEMNIDQSLLFRLDGIAKGLSNAHKVVILISQNPDFSADEKRQLIDATYFQMIEMATAGNTAMKEIRKQIESEPNEKTLH